MLRMLRHINTDRQYFSDGRIGGAPDWDYICAATPHSAWLRGVNTGRHERQEAGGFAERLRLVLQGHGSASGLAKAIERSEGAVRKWLRGESEPNVTDLRAICRATHTRIHWLVTGEGVRQTQAESDAASTVRETPPSYRQTPHAALDLPLLEAVLATADEQLRAMGLDLSPAKRSALIAAAYDLARGRNAVDAEAVARLVRLAGK